VEANLMAVLETLPLTTEQRRDRVEELLAQMGLEGVRESKAYVLSGGERRRLEIARSLVLSPSFVLLDEPFSGIDPLTVVDIQKIIADLSAAGIGVLVTDHNVRETLAVTNRAYIINDGKILYAGTPAALAANSEVGRVYVGEGFRLHCFYELAPAQTEFTSGAEAYSDAGPRADGQRAGAESSRAPGNDQSGNHGKPGGGGARRRIHYRRKLYRRNISQSGNEKSSRNPRRQSV